MNLLLASDLRDLVLAFCATSGTERSTSEVARLIDRGASRIAARAADPRVIAELRRALTSSYAVIKDGKGPRIAIYLDLIDASTLRRAILALGVHPKTRAMRLCLVVGLAEAMTDGAFQTQEVEALARLLFDVEAILGKT